MNDYKVTFSPELNINATEFTDSWNNLELCHKVAEAKTETATQGDYNLVDAAMLVSLVFIANVSSSLLTALIKEAIMDWYKKYQQANNPPPLKPESIEIREIEQPDGSKLVVVVLKQ
jgi:hypothetical protein